MLNKEYLRDMILIMDKKITKETNFKVKKAYVESLSAMRAELKEIQRNFPDSF